MSQVDTDINNYTLSDLLIILDIKDDEVDEDMVINKTNYYIQKYIQENNSKMAVFFSTIQTKLLEYVDELDGNNLGQLEEITPADEYKKDEEENPVQADVWLKNNHLKQQNNPTQLDKITERKQKIEVFSDSLHLPMKREQIGVNNNVVIPVAQDVLNPTLKNTITRMINLDSQFRQTTSGSNDISTDYTLDLSEPLLNVLSLKLHAFMISYTWYTIDVAYGNNCLWVTLPNNGPSINISVIPGNYNIATFQSELNSAFFKAGFTFTKDPVTVNTTNGLVTLNLYEGTFIDQDTSISYIIDDTAIITFFDPTSILVCNNNNVCNKVTAVNQTLGWIMGFRVINTLVSPSGNTGIAILDLFGPKYLIVVLDDFNQNHINNGLIGITEVSSTLKLPSYFSPDMLYTCVPPSPIGTNININNFELSNDTNAGNLVMDKMNITYKPIVQILPSAPRNLTQSQLYSINEIMKNNGKSMSLRTAAPTISNTFAIIPLKLGGLKFGDVYVESNGSLQDNKRLYFGPVNIERMRIKLLDDKGNILNLNGCDWSITLVSENLYQY